MASTVRSLREAASSALGAAGIPDPVVDAELLIGHVLGLSRGQVQAKIATGANVAPAEADAITAFVERRSQREPLQHITGRAPFRSLELRVGPGVFVPRPETEQVAGYAIDSLRATASATPVAVDLGSGSGAIALALALEVPHSTVYAIEDSADAFPWLQRNIHESGADNAHAVKADIADALPGLDGAVDVVVSNPPYIPTAAIPHDPEVHLFDPEHALYGGIDGLDVVRVVSRTARRLLHAGGTLVIEHGELQGEAIRALLTADGWHAAATHTDLLGRDRATIALR